MIIGNDHSAGRCRLTVNQMVENGVGKIRSARHRRPHCKTSPGSDTFLIALKHRFPEYLLQGENSLRDPLKSLIASSELLQIQFTD